MAARGQHDDGSNKWRGNRAEYRVRICWRRRLDAASSERPEPVRHDRFFQTDGGRKRVDDCQSERQHVVILLLRRCGTELPSIWPFVYVGIGAARMSVTRRSMAVAGRRRMAPDGEALWWGWERFARQGESGVHGSPERGGVGLG